MIRTPKQPSDVERIRAHIRGLRAEAKEYGMPSSLGGRHDRHVRARWDAHAEACVQLADLLTRLLREQDIAAALAVIEQS
jgi:hypothetical protein